MEIKYFPDTDTMLINFGDQLIVESRDLSENILVELDSEGDLVSLTIEHARNKMDVESFSYEKVSAHELA